MCVCGERERERERWVQVTLGVTLKSYTFFKSLDLSRSNGKKKHSLILIFLLGSHLLFRIYDIPYLSLKSKTGIHFLRSLFLLHCPYGYRPWIFGNVVPAYGVMNEQNPTFLCDLPIHYQYDTIMACSAIVDR